MRTKLQSLPQFAEDVTDDMPPRFQNWPLLVLVLVMLASGGLGGCAAASHRMLRNRPVTAALMAAYAIIGSVLGLLVYVVNDYLLIPAEDLPTLVAYSALLGFGGSTVLAATNIGLSVVLQKLGIRIDVQVDRERR